MTTRVTTVTTGLYFRRRSWLTALLASVYLFSQPAAFPTSENAKQITAAVSPQRTDNDDDIEPDRVLREENKIEQLKGLTRYQPGTNEVKAAKLLLLFRNSDMDAVACKKFYIDMAANGLRMTDIIRAKTWIEDAAIDNPSIRDDFLGNKFTGGGSTVEQSLLTYRRTLTRDIISQVVHEFAGRNCEHSVYLAEIGKWVGQPDKSLTFSGDIDFSFVSLAWIST